MRVSNVLHQLSNTALQGNKGHYNQAEQSKVGVFAFVGLNESGKTTILEAIHSFSPDFSSSELVGGKEKSGVPFKDRVPRHLISNFTGNVSVSATVKVTEEEKKDIILSLKAEVS